jgi:DNA-binding NarL/FixJ family response regulator
VVATARSLSELSLEVLAEVDVVVADVEAIGDEAPMSSEAGPALVLLLGHDDSHPAEWLLEGASVLAHDASAETIAAAACAAAAGLVASSRELIAEALRPARPWPASSASPHESLTAREMQVLEKLAQGRATRPSESRFTSPPTAKSTSPRSSRS